MPDEQIDNQDDEGQNQESTQDRNWRQMEEKLEAAMSRVQELEPLAVEKNIREAGYDPDSDKGKAIKYALQAKGAEAPGDSEGIQEFVTTEFGWQPGKVLSDEESSRQESQKRVDALRTESESETPSSDDIDEQIAQLESEDKWFEAGQLKLARSLKDQT